MQKSFFWPAAKKFFLTWWKKVFSDLLQKSFFRPAAKKFFLTCCKKNFSDLLQKRFFRPAAKCFFPTWCKKVFSDLMQKSFWPAALNLTRRCNRQTHIPLDYKWFCYQRTEKFDMFGEKLHQKNRDKSITRWSITEILCMWSVLINSYNLSKN